MSIKCRYCAKCDSLYVGLCGGLVATLIGLFTFILHWSMWDMRGGPLPGYNILLYPGNLTLAYLWHPLFTEELPLLQKAGLLLTGQFILVGLSVAVLRAGFGLLAVFIRQRCS